MKILKSYELNNFLASFKGGGVGHDGCGGYMHLAEHRSGSEKLDGYNHG